MEFVRPGAAFLLLLLPVLVLLHTRGGRRTARVVPSLALWAEVPEDARGTRVGRRPPVTLPLVLQALALVAVTAAIMQPGPAAPGASARRIVLVVDVSASMAATDVAPSRLAAATDAAREALDAAPRGARAALILAGDDPRLVVPFTGELDRLRAALPHGATDGGSDVAAAVSLALSVAGGSGARVHVYTDGALVPDDDSVRNHRIHGRPSNVSLSDLTAVSTGADTYSARLRVTNHGATLVRVPVVLTPSSGVPLAQAVSVAPGSHVEITFAGSALSVDDLALSAHARVADDLDGDNHAYAVLPARRPIQVVVVDARAGPLATLVALDELVDVVSVTPAEYLPRDGVALTVFRRWIPDDLPSGDVVILGPPHGSSYAPASRADDARFLGAETHPALRLVGLASVTVGGIGVYRPGSGPLSGVTGRTEGVMRTTAGPAAVSVEEGSRRVLVIGFDPFDLSATDLSLQPALVVLVGNVLEAARERSRIVPGGVVAGGPMPGELTPGSVAGPVEDVADAGPPILRAGIHTVTLPGRRPELVAANMPRSESELSRRPGVTAPSAGYPTDGAAGLHWRWCALAALFLLSAEWAAHHGRRAPA
jgi:Ca-activated chloride channel homolog